jgi:hypothetical protein
LKITSALKILAGFLENQTNSNFQRPKFQTRVLEVGVWSLFGGLDLGIFFKKVCPIALIFLLNQVNILHNII